VTVAWPGPICLRTHVQMPRLMVSPGADFQPFRGLRQTRYEFTGTRPVYEFRVFRWFVKTRCSVVAFSTVTLLPPGRTRVVGLAEAVGDDDDTEGDGDVDAGCAPGMAACPLLDEGVADGVRLFRGRCDGEDGE
jgi:hypothetical protein